MQRLQYMRSMLGCAVLVEELQSVCQAVLTQRSGVAG